jgi:hypothetical protein
VFYLVNPLPNLPPRGKEQNHLFPRGGHKKGGYLNRVPTKILLHGMWFVLTIGLNFQSPSGF